MVKRKKHQKDKKEFKIKSGSFLNQVPILVSKDEIYSRI